MEEPRYVCWQQEPTLTIPPADKARHFSTSRLLRGSSPLSNQVSTTEGLQCASHKTRLSPFQNTETSKHERTRIEASALHQLLLDILANFHNLLKALLQIQTRISKTWTVPPQPARRLMKKSVEDAFSLAAWLVALLRSMGFFARSVLNFLATTIKETHGLDHHVESEDLQSVLQELSSVQRRFVEFRESVEILGMNLASSSSAYETVLHPDRNPNLSSSKFTLDLSSAHSSLSSSILALTKHLETLEISSWNPTLLSPFDVKETAGSWKAIENLSDEVMPRMRTSVDRLVDSTIGSRFTARKEENELVETSLRIFRSEK
ncbi:hypothetical protein JCM5350_004210 [Sporobolomyces pararoseus]